jgi:hypothetical protein
LPLLSGLNALDACGKRCSIAEGKRNRSKHWR